MIGIRVEAPNNNPIVLLREREGNRYLPIWIGTAEASAIAHALQGIEPPRPQTHDLLKDVIDALGRRLEQVRIAEYRDNIYFAELVFDSGTTISARPSDAVALALRVGCEIYGAEAVLDEVGLPVPDEEEGEVERFREFLDSISPEDFEGLGPQGPVEGGPGEGGPGDGPS